VQAGPAAEQVLLLENIATSIKIGEEQLPSVHRLLVEAVGVDWCGVGVNWCGGTHLAWSRRLEEFGGEGWAGH
jgi:hypothetical protein